MGTTGTWVVLACEASASPVEQSLLPRIPYVRSRKGWSFFELAALLYPRALEQRVEEWSTKVDSAVIAYFVQDSDFAFLTGAYKGTREFRLIINPDVIEIYSAGVDAQKLLEKDGLPLNEMGVRDLIRWSRHAPSLIGAEKIREIIETNWTFAEVGVREILRAMELELPS